MVSRKPRGMVLDGVATTKPKVAKPKRTSAPRPRVATGLVLEVPNHCLPGPDFVRAATLRGDAPVIEGKGSAAQVVSHGAVLEHLYQSALYSPNFQLQLAGKNEKINLASCIAGHLWDRYDASGSLYFGPRPADVMVLGKQPGWEEAQRNRNLIGPSGQELWQSLLSVGFTQEELAGWYVTNLIHHGQVEPGKKTLPNGWIKNWLPVLHQELRIVRPRCLLILGSEAAKALLGPRAGVNETLRDVMPLTITCLDAKKEPFEHTIQVVTCTHPAAVLRAPDQRDNMLAALKTFHTVVHNTRDTAPPTDEHYVVHYESELRQLVDRAIAEGGPNPIIAIDGEWQGEYPWSDNAYLRTFQWSHRPGFACCVVVRAAGGSPGFYPSKDGIVRQLRRLLVSTPGRQVRIAGHHLRADLPWVKHHLDESLFDALLQQYTVAATPEAARHTGGIDTMLMAHAYRETGFVHGYKLEYVAQALLGVDRWNRELESWKRSYCLEHHLKNSQLEGYGDAPDSVLYPYGNYDVQRTRELAEAGLREGGFLDSDAQGNNCWNAYWISMLANPAFLEMELTGVHVDRSVGEHLTQLYTDVAAQLLEEIRHEARWPTFNPGSDYDRRELLFGEHYAGRSTPGPGRPEGALSLYLQPIKTTGKPSTPWDRVRRDKQEHLYSPATDKEVLGILQSAHPVVKKLRQQRFVAHVLTSALRRPMSDKDGELLLDENGDKQYEKGLLASVCNDGRVHTHYFQTKETGRASSARPGLQNLSKKRETDYAKILAEKYQYPIRSMLTTTPTQPGEDPWIGVDFDLCGAELKMAAIQSGDAVMLDHCNRNTLHKSHPDYYDIHSSIAVSAFGLDCPPTKKGLESLGKESLRIAAKAVIFGKLYGRGDVSVQRSIQEEDMIDITVEQARKIGDYIFTTYSKLAAYFTACQSRVLDPGWLRNSFGRLRRFARTNDKTVLASTQREAMNFNIQSGIADMVSHWAAKICHHLERRDTNGQMKYRMLLQNHDALQVECKVSHLEWFCDKVVRATLAEIPVYQCDLEGKKLYPEQPHFMSTEIEIFRRWGYPVSREEGLSLGLPSQFLAA